MAANGGKNSPKQISQQVDELNKKLGVTQGKLEDINQTLTVTQAQSQKATQRIGKNLKDINATLVSLQKEARAADARLARMVITGDAIRKSLVNGMTQSSTAMTTAAVSADRMNTHLHKTNMTTQDVVMNARRMTTAFQYAFALNPITMFLRKMIEVRGEFEMQSVALRAIMQNKDEADQLFNQITQLAVKSPFRVKDLLTYTKQLAAYRIENDQLYDTTKRLADVSAGLGVDIGRLILAYGQVKTANFLRASEVRQFTEAGVNMYGELARYFTELEGKAVSTADVVERVSKRMVKFEDVAEVFRRMTNEGGIFYDMQEKQSYTVQGQIGKLKDSIDLMLNDIGTAQQGTIKDAVTTLTDLLKHWDDVWTMMKTIAIEYGILKTSTIAMSLAQGKLTGVKRIDNAVSAAKLNIERQTIAKSKETQVSLTNLSNAYKKKISAQLGTIEADKEEALIKQSLIANIDAVITAEQREALAAMGVTSAKKDYIAVAYSKLNVEQQAAVMNGNLATTSEIYQNAVFKKNAAIRAELAVLKQKELETKKEIELNVAEAASVEKQSVANAKHLAEQQAELTTLNKRIFEIEGNIAAEKEYGTAKNLRRLETRLARLETERETTSERIALASKHQLEIQERCNATVIKSRSLQQRLANTQSRISILQTQTGTVAVRMLTSGVNKLKVALVGLKSLLGGQLLLTGLMVGIGALVSKFTEASRKAKELQESLDKLDKESATESFRLQSSYIRLTGIIKDETKSYEEQKQAVEALNREFGDILPARFLEIQHIKEETNATEQATAAIREYIRVKLEEKKREEVNKQEGEEYYEQVKKREEEMAEVLNEILNLDLKPADIHQIIAPLLDELDSGLISLDEFNKKFAETISNTFGDLVHDAYKAQLEEALSRISNSANNDNMANAYATLYSGGSTPSDNTKRLKEEAILKTQANTFDKFASMMNTAASGISRAAKNYQDAMNGIEEQTSNWQNKILGDTQAALDKNVKLWNDYMSKAKGGFVWLNVQWMEGMLESIPKLDNLNLSEKSKELINGIIPQEMLDGDVTIDWNRVLNEAGYEQSIQRMFQISQKLKEIEILSNIINDPNSSEGARSIATQRVEKLAQEISELKLTPLQSGIQNLVTTWQNGNTTAQAALKLTAKQMDEYLVKSGESAKDYAKRIKTEIENLENDIKKSKNKNVLESERKYKNDSEISAAEALLILLKQLGVASGEWTEKATKGGAKRQDNLNSEISLLKELNSEYNKLIKNYDKETAKAKIRDSYTKAVAKEFEDINKKYKTTFSIDDFDFTSEEGMAASIEKLRKVAQQMDKRNKTKGEVEAALEKAIAPFVAEVEVRPIVKDRETFKQTMDDVIDDYNKTLEASNLGISTNLAERLFGIGGTGLQDLRFALENYANQYLRNADGSFKGEEGQKEYEKWLEKINDMEDKAVQERMKKYVKYLNQSYTEVAAARAKLMQQFLEIDSLDVEDSVKKQMKEGAKRESDEAVGKAMWNEFKDSGMYVELFNNLENASNQAIDAMIARLQGLGDQMKNLDPSQLKAIYEQIEKLEKVKMERGSLSALFDYASQAREMRGRGRTEDVVDTELAAARERELQIQQKITDNQLLAKAAQTGQLDVLAEQLGIQNEVAAIIEKYGGDSNLIAQYYTDQANAQQKSLQETKLQVSELQKEKGVFNNLRKSSKQFASDWKSVSNTMKSSWNEAFDVFEAVGGELTNEQKAYKEVGNAILDVIAIIPTYVAGMTAAGVAINSAMGIIGLIAEAISLTMGLIKALAGMNDAKQQDKIDDLSKKVRQLEQDFEDLEEAMEHAMNSTDYLKSYEDALDNIDERIQKTREMADAERAKKDTDEEKLQEYADNVRDLEKEREELKQKLIEDWGGLGRDNWRSMAEDFVSAWMDAFEETGDGLEGLEKKFDEWLKNWFQKQATMKVASAMLEPLFRMIDEMTSEERGLGLDTNEMEQIRQRAAEIFPQLNESLKEMWEAFDMGGGAVDSLTGLQQGIEGITEATAEVIEGYLNSIRYFVAEDNAILIQIRDSIVGGVAGSGIADNVASMRNLLEQINNKLPDMTPFANQGGVMGLNVRIVE